MDIDQILDFAHRISTTQAGQSVIGGLVLAGLFTILRLMKRTARWLLRGGLEEGLLGLLDRSSRRSGLL